MKLLRYGDKGQEKPGALDSEGKVRDLSGVLDDISGITLQPSTLSRLEKLDLNTLPLVSSNVRLGPCVANVGKFLCIGLNYRDHADETGATYPEEPVIFMKATNSISGPNDAVIIPHG